MSGTFRLVELKTNQCRDEGEKWLINWLGYGLASNPKSPIVPVICIPWPHDISIDLYAKGTPCATAPGAPCTATASRNRLRNRECSGRQFGRLARQERGRS